MMCAERAELDKGKKPAAAAAAGICLSNPRAGPCILLKTSNSVQPQAGGYTA